MCAQAQKGKGLPEPLIWKFMIQALLGLQHIHSKKIIHRDMKALNLFLDANDNIKVCRPQCSGGLPSHLAPGLLWLEAGH